MGVHAHSALPFHRKWEEEGYVLIRSVRCSFRVMGGKDGSCYEGTTDPLEAADWIIVYPAGSYFLKGRSSPKFGGHDDYGWTRLDINNYTEQTNKLRWEPSIAAAMEIAACWMGLLEGGIS